MKKRQLTEKQKSILGAIGIEEADERTKKKYFDIIVVLIIMTGVIIKSLCFPRSSIERVF